MIPSLFEGRERLVLPPAGAVSICFLFQCSRAVLRGFGRPGVFSYSDRVILEPILRRLAAELDLFPALVPVPKNSMYTTESQFLLLLRCGEACASWPKTGDVNNTELPHLEGLSRNVTKVSHVISSALVTLTSKSAATLVSYIPLVRILPIPLSQYLPVLRAPGYPRAELTSLWPVRNPRALRLIK